MKTMRLYVLAVLVAGLGAVPALAQPPPPPNYQVGNFDVYKYATSGDPIPDVDKQDYVGHVGSNSCWQATAANMLAASGYGIGAGVGATAQQRADHIYTQLTNDLGTANMGCCERAINYWLYTYGKNPSSAEFMPGNQYTDVTIGDAVPLLPYVAPPGANPYGSYNWLLDELQRCQYVGIALSTPAHCLTLVGGNYFSNPFGQPDGDKSIVHDSDGAAPGHVGPAGGDNPDTVTHPPPIGALVDDDVYTNVPVGAGQLWALSDYWSGHTGNVDRWYTLCQGLNKPTAAMQNFDLAYYLQAADPDLVLDDPMFRASGKPYQYVWYPDGVTLHIENETVPDWHKEVYLLVDYTDRVAGRQAVENITLQTCDGRVLAPTSVQASADDGQLLFTWILDYQPMWENIIFPNAKYSTLAGNVKDWDVSTICVPEPATLALLGAGVAMLLARRRRR